MILIQKDYTFAVSHSSSWRTDEMLGAAITACFVSYVDTLRTPTDAIFGTTPGEVIYFNEVWLDGEVGERIRRWVGLFDTRATLDAKMQHHGLSSHLDELNVPYHAIGATLTIKVEDV
jgi:hypothetical protein